MNNQPAGWVVVQGRIVWGLSWRSAVEARADADKQIGWYFRRGEPKPTDLQTLPATSAMLEAVESKGGGADGAVWHVAEGGVAEAGLGSQRELFARRDPGPGAGSELVYGNTTRCPAHEAGS